MEKPKKNKPYMMYLKQSLSPFKAQYQVYRDGMNVVYTIEGDVTRHRFSVHQGENEVLVLHKKIAKLFAEYTIEKDGQEISHIKKGLFSSLSGQVTVPAAQFTQDQTTGEWSVQPGISTLTITGNI